MNQVKIFRITNLICNFSHFKEIKCKKVLTKLIICGNIYLVEGRKTVKIVERRKIRKGNIWVTKTITTQIQTQ